jgi:pseudaminic acid cytidylyltransferase
MKRLAIIPARGGSKRIPNKNIRNFCGQPMISYILKEAEKSNLFDKIHVSTDSKMIASVVKNLGYVIDFMRPGNLSDDNTTLEPVIDFVLKQYMKSGLLFDEVWLLLPCSPLIKADDLIDASTFLRNRVNSKKGIIAVVEFPTPIDWAYEIKTDGTLNPLDKNKLCIRSQDLEKRYYDSGTFMSFFVDNDSISNNPKLINDSFFGYKISKLKGIDIDTVEDWELAESLYIATNSIKNN